MLSVLGLACAGALGTLGSAMAEATAGAVDAPESPPGHVVAAASGIASEQRGLGIQAAEGAYRSGSVHESAGSGGSGAAADRDFWDGLFDGDFWGGLGRGLISLPVQIVHTAIRIETALEYGEWGLLRRLIDPREWLTAWRGGYRACTSGDGEISGKACSILALDAVPVAGGIVGRFAFGFMRHGLIRGVAASGKLAFRTVGRATEFVTRRTSITRRLHEAVARRAERWSSRTRAVQTRISAWRRGEFSDLEIRDAASLQRP